MKCPNCGNKLSVEVYSMGRGKSPKMCLYCENCDFCTDCTSPRKAVEEVESAYLWNVKKDGEQA